MSTVPGERAKKGKRSRIVVNVEPQPAATKDRRAGVERWQGVFRARRAQGRRRRVLSVAALALAGVTLVLLAGGYRWWQSFKSSPSYTLALAVDAAERDDQPAFEALVDIEEVSRSVVPQVIERMRVGDNSLNISPQVRRQIAQNAQVWLPGVREGVRGLLMGETKRLAEQSGARAFPFFVRALALSRLGESKTQAAAAGGEGNADTKTASVLYRINERPVAFGLKGGDAEGQPDWKIVSVKSDELATRVAEGVAKTFPMVNR